VVLVRLTYARGWRLPGGGRERGETPVEGVLRELREEIGLTGHGAVERLADIGTDGRPGDQSALFVVREVDYRPRRSLESAEVREFDLADLPADVARSTRAILDAFAGG
jgi:ADP-ribose pyrophosphatase YjhB (NUDIX family)